MKRLLYTFIVCCLVYTQAFAVMNPYIAGQTVVSGITCDDCSGDLSLAIHFENDTDIEVGTPCGCSDGSTTLTLSNAVFSAAQKSDGTYSLYCANAEDYATVPVSNYDIISDAAGTITFDLYIVTWTDDAHILLVFDNGDGLTTDYLSVDMISLDELRLRYEGGNQRVSATTTDWNLSTGQWYSITVKWTQSAVNPNLSIASSAGTTATSDTDLDDIGVANEWEIIYMGIQNVQNAEYYLDNIKVYNSWQ